VAAWLGSPLREPIELMASNDIRPTRANGAGRLLDRRRPSRVVASGWRVNIDLVEVGKEDLAGRKHEHVAVE